MDKRKSLVGIGLILALMTFTGYMLLRDMSFSRLAGTLRQLNPLWLLAGLGMMFLFVGSEAMCSRVILGRLGHPVRYRRWATPLWAFTSAPSPPLPPADSRRRSTICPGIRSPPPTVPSI